MPIFNHHWRQRERLYAMVLSICLFVLQKQSNLELCSLLLTNRKSYIGFSKKPFMDPKNQGGGHLENRQVAVSQPTSSSAVAKRPRDASYLSTVQKVE